MVMKRHQGLVPLSQEHKQGLLLAQVMKKDAPPYRGMPTDVTGKKDLLKNSFNDNLKPHFKKEEEVLFPEIKGIDDKVDQLVEELIEDHQKIANLTDEILTMEHPKDKMDELGHLLEKHIRKEERELFERLQEILEEEQLSSFKERF